MRQARMIALFLFVGWTIQVPLTASANPGLSVSPIGGTVTPTTMAQKLAGPGVTLSTITYSGANNASGEFSGGTGIIGFEDGIVLTSGSATNVIGPNSADNITAVNGTSGDPDLEALSGVGAGNSFDAAVLEFNFTPTASTIFVNYVFSSEEYNEYVYQGFNDAFGFFVNGAGNGTGNCALVPSTSDPVSVDTINNGYPFGDPNASHPELYRNNDVQDGGGSIDTQMDGLTTVLTCQASVNANVSNHMKLAIADTGDAQYDSAVFLQSNSLSTTPLPGVPGKPTINQATAGNTEVGLNWSAPSTDGGSPITSYTVYASPCPTANPSPCPVLQNVSPTPNAAPFDGPNPTTFSYFVTGLQNGQLYAFTVTASNVNGEGPASDPVTATPNASADTNQIQADGTGSVDTGFGGGALTCSGDPSSVSCKNVVAKYSLSDPKDVGALIGLGAIPNSQTPGGPIACLEFDFASGQTVAGGDCETVADKALISTYPTSVATLTVPHLAFEQDDASVTTLELGAPCLQLYTNANGTPQLSTDGEPICKSPDFPHNFGSAPVKTNMCPDGTGWTKALPCAYIYYKVERIDGYDLTSAGCTWPNCTWGTLTSPTGTRPVECSSGPNCGKEVIIGSSVSAGIKLASGEYAVRPWCQGKFPNFKWLPCDFKVNWLNKSTAKGNNDVQWQDYEVADPGGSRTG
jgi:hypothetical protein